MFHLMYTRSTDHMERRYRESENTAVPQVRYRDKNNTPLNTQHSLLYLRLQVKKKDKDYDLPMALLGGRGEWQLHGAVEQLWGWDGVSGVCGGAAIPPLPRVCVWLGVGWGGELSVSD